MYIYYTCVCVCVYIHVYIYIYIRGSVRVGHGCFHTHQSFITRHRHVTLDKQAFRKHQLFTGHPPLVLGDIRGGCQWWPGYVPITDIGQWLGWFGIKLIGNNAGTGGVTCFITILVNY